jgi:hypothetical protein
LSGANLSGANLRWADLSGSDLSWADLSGAKLSGANLTGANLSHANLLTSSLVHVDLTRANLMSVDWAGADLSGATLTGAKLYDVLRFGIKTEGIICEWVDLSPNGDQSNIRRLGAEANRTFFHETPPTVRIVIDARFDLDAHYALAAAYRYLAKTAPVKLTPPNIQTGRRRTTLTFELKSDDQLFLTAYVTILPFGDAVHTQTNLLTYLQQLNSTEAKHRFQTLEQPQRMNELLDRFRQQTPQCQLSEASRQTLAPVQFLQSPTKTLLINSSGQSLIGFNHPLFGKRQIERSDLSLHPPSLPVLSRLPELSVLIDFVQSFHFSDSI